MFEEKFTTAHFARNISLMTFYTAFCASLHVKTSPGILHVHLLRLKVIDFPLGPDIHRLHSSRMVCLFFEFTVSILYHPVHV